MCFDLFSWTLAVICLFGSPPNSCFLVFQVVEVVQGQFEIDWMEGVVPGWPVSDPPTPTPTPPPSSAPLPHLSQGCCPCFHDNDDDDDDCQFVEHSTHPWKSYGHGKVMVTLTVRTGAAILPNQDTARNKKGETGGGGGGVVPRFLHCCMVVRCCAMVGCDLCSRSDRQREEELCSRRDGTWVKEWVWTLMCVFTHGHCDCCWKGCDCFMLTDGVWLTSLSCDCWQKVWVFRESVLLTESVWLSSVVTWWKVCECWQIVCHCVI